MRFLFNFCLQHMYKTQISAEIVKLFATHVKILVYKFYTFLV